MKIVFYISLLLCSIWACKNANIQSVMEDKVTLSGEWRYVGKFSHNADYKCIICPEFDYEKSIYKIIFKEDGTFDARINLGSTMIYTGLSQFDQNSSSEIFKTMESK